MSLFLGTILSFVTSFILTPILREWSRRQDILDIPNARSSHSQPTPRIGGVAILVGAAVGCWVTTTLFRGDKPLIAISASALAIIALAGFLDDLVGITVRAKLAFQLAAALIIVFVGGWRVEAVELPFVAPVALSWFSYAISLLWLVGITNAYNFMDGINGIASFQALSTGAAFTVLFIAQQDPVFAAIAACFAAAATGFLPWNFPVASIFMGDVGSGALGFAYGALALRLVQGGLPLIAAILPLMPFLFDTTLTLLRRIRKRDRIFVAHRTHLYQRLTTLGFSHATVTMLWFSLAILSGGIALRYGDWSDSARLLSLGGVTICHLALWRAILAGERIRPAVDASGIND